MNSIVDYIRETPEKMHHILKMSEDLFEEIKVESFDRIVLTGSGTSYHAGVQCKKFLQSVLKVEVEALYPFMITDDYLESADVNTLVVGISQGGSSYSTYRAMEKAKEKGCKVASMAGMEQALIDEVADYVLTIHCGPEEAGAKTKGFTCTKLNIFLLGIEVALERQLIDKNTHQAYLAELQKVINGYDKVYQQSIEWVERNKEKLASTKEMRIVGTEDVFGNVLEGALKLLETLRVPVSGYEFEEFVHGIYNAVNEDSTLLFIDTGKEERMGTLISTLSEWTSHVFLISNGKETKGEGLNLALEDNLFNDMLYIVPIQLICGVVPQIKGIDPAVPKDRDFHRKLKSKKLD